MKLTRPIEIEEGEIKKRHVCPYCEKEFSNGKALGGHKRIHLYKMRGRKNLKLPFSSNLNSESVVSVSDLEQVPAAFRKVLEEDLKDVLPRWGSVGKRGKMGYGHIIRTSSNAEKMIPPPSQFIWPNKLRAEKGDHQRVHSFDLNELPPEAVENGLD